jgi:hypothetical protein
LIGYPHVLSLLRGFLNMGSCRKPAVFHAADPTGSGVPAPFIASGSFAMRSAAVKVGQVLVFDYVAPAST